MSANRLSEVNHLCCGEVFRVKAEDTVVEGGGLQVANDKGGPLAELVNPFSPERKNHLIGYIGVGLCNDVHVKPMVNRVVLVVERLIGIPIVLGNTRKVG